MITKHARAPYQTYGIFLNAMPMLHPMVCSPQVRKYATHAVVNVRRIVSYYYDVKQGDFFLISHHMNGKLFHLQRNIITSHDVLCCCFLSFFFVLFVCLNIYISSTYVIVFIEYKKLLIFYKDHKQNVKDYNSFYNQGSALSITYVCMAH